MKWYLFDDAFPGQTARVLAARRAARGAPPLHHPFLQVRLGPHATAAALHLQLHRGRRETRVSPPSLSKERERDREGSRLPPSRNRFSLALGHARTCPDSRIAFPLSLSLSLSRRAPPRAPRDLRAISRTGRSARERIRLLGCKDTHHDGEEGARVLPQSRRKRPPLTPRRLRRHPRAATLTLCWRARGDRPRRTPSLRLDAQRGDF